MQWHLKYQNQLEWFEQLEEDGQDVTGVMASKPDLFDDLLPYWTAFHYLNGSRQSGFGIGPIPLSEYKAYFEIFDIRGLEEREYHLKFVGALDSVFVEHTHKKSEAKSNAKGKGVAPKRPSSSPKKAAGRKR